MRERLREGKWGGREEKEIEGYLDRERERKKGVK